MPKTGIEPISKSYKEFVLPIKLFRLINKQNKKKEKLFCFLFLFLFYNNIINSNLPRERIELTFLYLQNSALTTKQSRLII